MVSGRHLDVRLDRPANPKEIAYFDRGPIDANRLVSGGSWSVYWYNGVLVSSEIARGLDIYELAAERAHLAERDRRGQDREVRLLEHAGAAEVRLAAELRDGAGVRRSARALEGPVDREDRVDTRGTRHRREASGGQRRTALTTLATQLNADAAGSSDPAKVKMLAAAVTDLAK